MGADYGVFLKIFIPMPFKYAQEGSRVYVDVASVDGKSHFHYEKYFGKAVKYQPG